MTTPSIERGDVLQLTVDSSGFEGISIARHNNMVVFVEGAVAGDVVRAKVFKVKKKHVEARTIEVLVPSPERTVPRCRYFGICGGCRWQHVRYASQLNFKRRHVEDSLQRIGGFTGVDVQPVYPSADEYFYRNKLEFSFGDQKWLTEDEFRDTSVVPRDQTGDLQRGFALGFHIPQRYDKILDIDECHLQSELSNSILRLVRTFAHKHSLPAYSDETKDGYFRNLVIREGKNTGDVMVNVVTFTDNAETMKALTTELTSAFPEITTIVNNVTARASQVAVGEYENVYYGEGVIREKIGNKVFHISANSFFQTNTRQTETLYALVKEFAELTSNDLVFDLYCGTGSIALTVADSVRRVVGIDVVQSSIENARMNAAMNGIQNCDFLLGDLKELMTENVAWREHYSSPDVVIVDPPRSGMHPHAVEELGKMHVRRVVYVSCNPATLARDVKLLAPFGYTIEKVQPVDMFPHTYHIESVVKLSLRSM